MSSDMYAADIITRPFGMRRPEPHEVILAVKVAGPAPFVAWATERGNRSTGARTCCVIEIPSRMGIVHGQPAAGGDAPIARHTGADMLRFASAW